MWAIHCFTHCSENQSMTEVACCHQQSDTSASLGGVIKAPFRFTGHSFHSAHRNVTRHSLTQSVTYDLLGALTIITLQPASGSFPTISATYHFRRSRVTDVLESFQSFRVGILVKLDVSRSLIPESEEICSARWKPTYPCRKWNFVFNNLYYII